MTPSSIMDVCRHLWALLIVAENNPGFQVTTEEVDIDIDAQSESTLWRLKFFVKEALQVQGKSAASTGNTNHNNDNNKRKREIRDAPAKTSQKRITKLPLYMFYSTMEACGLLGCARLQLV
ncbi:hypothetical protein Vadar_029005 [Vaccinium darrowii]|uniref:Uncharacterized protein n=1 Tax=Vaccinium darrowii TaxID=229202 RepID=A0ACB7XUE5_9ERIC|nr:hypothetical protein Vadar_029005 [Vaccinium darrowii]